MDSLLKDSLSGWQLEGWFLFAKGWAVKSHFKRFRGEASPGTENWDDSETQNQPSEIVFKKSSKFILTNFSNRHNHSRDCNGMV